MVTNWKIEAAQFEIDELANVHYVLGTIRSSGVIRPEELATVTACKPLLGSGDEYLIDHLTWDSEKGACPIESATDLQTFVGFAMGALQEKKALEIGLQVIEDEALDDKRALGKLRAFTFSFTLELDPTCADDCYNRNNAIHKAQQAARYAAFSLGCGDKAASAAEWTASVTLSEQNR